MPPSSSPRPDPQVDLGGRGLFLAITALVAWGALAFGSPYPWAYVPLALASGALGLLLFWRARHVSVPAIGDGPLIAALAIAAAAAALQLMPLSPQLREAISPASTGMLESLDLRYAVTALAPSAGRTTLPWHALSINPSATLTGLGLLAALTMLLAGLTSFFSRESLAPLVPWLLAFALALAVVGIVQKAVLGDNVALGMRVYGFWEPQQKLTTPFGPFINKNHFAGWMLMAIPLGLGYFLGLLELGLRHVRRGWRNRLLWLSSTAGGHLQLVAFALVIMVVALLMTRSRSGIACFGVAMGLAGVFVVRQLPGMKSRLVALVALAALAVVPLAWARVDVASRFATGPSDPSLQLRRAIWHDTLAIIRDFPVAGTGLNTFGTATVKYQSSGLDMHYREAHNDYLQIAAEGGVLLGVPAALAVFFLVRGIWRRFAESTDDRLTYWLRFGATTGLVAVALQSMVEFSLQMPGNAVLFVVLCAAALHRAPYVKMPARGTRLD